MKEHPFQLSILMLGDFDEPSLKINVNVNVRAFLGRRRNDRYFKELVLTARIHTCSSLSLWLHKPHVAILTATRITFAVFCSGHPLHTSSCSYQKDGIPSAESRLSASGMEPRPPARMNVHASERPTT